MAPICKFSNTVMRGKMRRPSGDWAMRTVEMRNLLTRIEASEAAMQSTQDAVQAAFDDVLPLLRQLADPVHRIGPRAGEDRGRDVGPVIDAIGPAEKARRAQRSLPKP
mgnify:CR=1 FL=1